MDKTDLATLELKSTPEGTRIEIYVQPGASKTQWSGLHGGVLKLRIKAPPVEGKANEEVTCFLADVFKLKKQSVHLLLGDKNRNKVFLLRDLTPDQVRSILEAALT